MATAVLGVFAPAVFSPYRSVFRTAVFGRPAPFRCCTPAVLNGYGGSLLRAQAAPRAPHSRRFVAARRRPSWAQKTSESQRSAGGERVRCGVEFTVYTH